MNGVEFCGGDVEKREELRCGTENPVDVGGPL
jgi:hypothetical protein